MNLPENQKNTVIETVDISFKIGEKFSIICSKENLEIYKKALKVYEQKFKSKILIKKQEDKGGKVHLNLLVVLGSFNLKDFKKIVKEIKSKGDSTKDFAFSSEREQTFSIYVPFEEFETFLLICQAWNQAKKNSTVIPLIKEREIEEKKEGWRLPVMVSGGQIDLLEFKKFAQKFLRSSR